MIVPATREDVIRCYKTILKREPESEEVIQNQLLDAPSLWDLVERFIDSDEVRESLRNSNPLESGTHPEDFGAENDKAFNNDLARVLEHDSQFTLPYMERGRGGRGRPKSDDNQHGGTELSHRYRQLELLHSAGLPSPIRISSHAARSSPLEASLPFDPGTRIANCLALIATRNFLPFVKLAAQNFLRHHDEFTVFLLLADGEPGDVSLFPEGTVVFLSDLGLESAGWYAAKYNAAEFVNSLKPVFLRFLSGFVDRAIYLDSDIIVFSRLGEMIEALETKDLVMIPHVLSPYPRPEQFWLHPNNADIFNSGLVNAGCFGIRLGRCAQFLQFWQDANLAPGTFYHATGYQTDQQYLNWALVMVPEACIVREARYNIAYWNLHERNLRLKVDSDEPPAFEVDGKPLGFFHFSGYDVSDKFKLSRHDGRHFVYDLPAVAEVLNWYSDKILSSPLAELRHESYKFDRLPNGFPMNGFVRELLKKYEAYARKIDPRTRVDADQLCAFLMDPLPATGSMLPLIAAEIYESRPDLQSAFPGSHTAFRPSRFMNWFYRHAGEEYKIQFLIDRFRRTLISDSIVGFVEAVSALLGNTPSRRFLGPDRMEAVDYLRASARGNIAEELLEARNEWYFFTDLGAVLVLYHSRPDLQEQFPDILGCDHEAFTNWLLIHSIREHGVPPDGVKDFATRTADGCLAKIFSYLARREDLAEACGTSLLSDDSQQALRALIPGAGDGLEYDLGDVEILRFIHLTSRHLLIPLYLELPFVRRRPAASRLLTHSVAMLPEKIQPATWARRGCELYASYFDRFEAQLEEEIRRRTAATATPSRDVVGFLRIADDSGRSATDALELARRMATRHLAMDDAAAAGLCARLKERERFPAVNVFGHYYADTGVGESARGLARTIALLRPVNPVPLYTSHVQDGITLSRLFQRFDYLSDTNVFVSYPHQREDMFGMMPPEYFVGRRNIVHLAWEQKDFHPWWKIVYDRYDEIWAISEFSAEPFRRMFPGRVRVVPNVLPFEEYPVCEEESRNRLKGDRLKFLFVFDANSTMERKNPEAVIDAFIKAFKGTSFEQKAQLTLKIRGMHRAEHSDRIACLMRKARASGLTIDFDGRHLSRDGLMRFIAAADCYISLHRSEGFGYTMAEAMFYGVPVIASGYSGNLEYMSPTNSFLVPCEEMFVKAPDGPFQRGSVWGEPDIERAAALMRFVAEKPLDALAVGECGRKTVLEKLNAVTVAEKISCFFDTTQEKIPNT
jgi:glycosyltransferase involved in cell wall biosynthesis